MKFTHTVRPPLTYEHLIVGLGIPYISNKWTLLPQMDEIQTSGNFSVLFVRKRREETSRLSFRKERADIFLSREKAFSIFNQTTTERDSNVNNDPKVTYESSLEQEIEKVIITNLFNEAKLFEYSPR